MLLLYANAEAVEAPTAENTLVLTANEAVELPEAFANAILAVVKTESLPAAVPVGSAVALSCTLDGAYNYPFKNIRIFNCNLEDALGEAAE